MSKGRGRLYSIRGASTKAKIKKHKGSSGFGGGAGGKAWYELLHCRYPRTPDGMCYHTHSQFKVDPSYKVKV